MTHQFKYIFYCNSKIHSVCTCMLNYTYIFLYLLWIGELFQPVILWILWFHSIQIICIIQHKLISGPFPWQCVIWVLRSLERDLLFVIVSSTMLVSSTILLGWDTVFAYLLLNSGVFRTTIRFYIYLYMYICIYTYMHICIYFFFFLKLWNGKYCSQ